MQRPRIWHAPPFISSAGQEAIECAALAGLHLDEGQQFVLVNALGETPLGKWAAFEVGVEEPRQNGKGSILEARELAGAFVFGEKLIIHSAHEQITSSEHFRRLLMLIEGVPEFDRRVLKVVRGKGAEAIELRGGQRIFFKTRTGGAGRGLTGDLVVLDEAMIVPVATTAALVPTMAARSITGNPQLWYTGSAVDQQKHEHGLVFARLRERGHAGAGRVAWFEWSIEGEDPDKVPEEVAADPRSWAQANPGMGVRISAEHIANERGALGAREFAVERLGVGDWPNTDPNAGQVIPVEQWRAFTDHGSTIVDTPCFAIDTTPDRSKTAIGTAGRREDGRHHVEVIDHRPGTGWVIDRVVELKKKWKPLAFVIDERSAAASLIKPLENAGIEVKTTDPAPKPGMLVKANTSDHAKAYGMFYDAADQDRLRHLGTAELEAAIRGATTRPLGDGTAWSRSGSDVDISPLVACTLALWGSETQQPPARRPMVAFR